MAKSKRKYVNPKKYICKEEYEEAEHESFERMLKDFNRRVQNERIIKTARDNMYYIKPSDKKRAYARNLRRKALKQMRRYKES